MNNDKIEPQATGKAKRLKNLEPKETLSVEEAKKLGHSGGVKSGEARREKKKLSELANILAELPVKGKNKATLVEMGFDPELATNATLMIAGLHRRAVSGDPAAAKLYAEIMGQPPVSKSEVGTYEVRKIEEWEE